MKVINTFILVCFKQGSIDGIRNVIGHRDGSFQGKGRLYIPRMHDVRRPVPYFEVACRPILKSIIATGNVAAAGDKNTISAIKFGRHYKSM